jgi:protein TonB
MEEEGTVLLRVTIGTNGRVEAVEIEESSGFPRLDQAALKAIRAWRFAPATRGGQAVASWVTVPVTFQLRR